MRRIALAVLALLCASGTSCRDDTVAPLAFEVPAGQRPLEDAQAGRYELPSDLKRGELLLELPNATAPDWLHYDAERKRVPSASFDAAQPLDLRGPSIAVMLLPIESVVAGPPTGRVVVNGRLATAGMSGDVDLAQAVVGVFQLNVADAEFADYDALLPHVLARKFSSPVIENHEQGVRVRFDLQLDPGCRTLMVMASVSDRREPQVASESAQADTKTARATLLDLHLRREGPLEIARALAAPDPDRPFDADFEHPTLARYDIALESRYGIALPSGATARLPYEFPDAAFDLECAFGLAADSNALASDARVRLDIAFEANGAETSIASTELEQRDAIELRWHELRVPLPAGLHGQTGEWVLRAKALGPPLAGCVPVVAGLRLAPRSAASRPADAPPNVVLISLDTVRADHLSLYGYPLPTSPHLDALGRESRWFREAWSTCSYTLPSHLSLFTGQYPSVHGVQRPSQRADPTASPMLTERLAHAGYATGAFTGGGMVLPHFGFARGFDVYDFVDPMVGPETPHAHARVLAIPGFSPAIVNERGLARIRRFIGDHANEPFFLFAHTYAAHEFKPAPEDLDAIDAHPDSYADAPEHERYLVLDELPPPPTRRWLTERYDASIRTADRLIGSIRASLAEYGLSDDTIIVVVSDHGKELGDRTRAAHGHQVQREMVRVPLILHIPGGERGPSDRPASIADVAPTLLAHLGLEPFDSAQGTNLVAASKPSEQRPLWAEMEGDVITRVHWFGDTVTLADAVLDAGGEPVAAEVRSYDYENDPEQRHARPATRAEVETLESYLAQLDTLHANLMSASSTAGGNAAQLGEDQRAQLRALGYLTDEAEARE